MVNQLTSVEFKGIRSNLEYRSDTWADLWVLLYLTHARVTQLIRCQYQDIHDNVLVLTAHNKSRKKILTISRSACVIIRHRRQRYPDDIYLFQSHSRRVRATARPVTVIAFNTALKKAARGITHKTVSSKSAFCPRPQID